MKFFSVFVLYFYVRTSYSFYTGQPVSTNPNVGPNEYPVTDTQNTYQTNQAGSFGNVQNAYPSGQPNQVEYKMGPGYPIPYQATQNSLQSNPQANNGKLPNHFYQITSHPYLREFYKKSNPKKRYTIVHPNGTIEHTDEIHRVTARYPNYLMVKAADILANSNGYQNPTGPVRNALPAQENKPVTTTNQQAQWSSTNSYQGSYSNQNTNNEARSYTNSNSQESVVESKQIPNNSDSGASNPATINDSTVKQSTQEVNNIQTGDLPKETSNNPTDVQEISNNDANVVAGNPLPIYPATPVSDSAATNDQSNPTVANSVGDANAVLDSKSAVSNNNVENKTLSNDITTSTEPISTSQVPADVDKSEIVPVILPVVSDQSKPQEIETVTAIEESPQSETTPEIATIEEPLQSKNIVTDSNTPTVTVLEANTILDVSTPKDVPNESLQPINVPKTPSQQVTNATEIVESHSNSTITSVPEQSPTTPNNDKPIWFHLSNENIWDAIRNNASNVYFFFLPPQPKRLKETRTTIYPNGTTVSEIIQTDVDIGEDGEPREIKNTTVLVN